MTKDWKQPGKILVATDLSPKSGLAVARAIHLAAHWRARLYVMHAVDDVPLSSFGVASVQAKAAATEMERQLKSIPAAASIEHEVVTALGKPVERILGKCDTLLVDLLVVGAGERRTLGQRLLGTTVGRVLRQAQQPVLSVRTPTAGPYRKLAIATDFSEPSRVAMDCALALFPNVDAEVVHAYEVTLTGLIPSDRFTGPLAERHEREMKEHVQRSLADLIAQKLASAPNLSSASGIGTPESVLTGFVERDAVDLVAIGTHGRTGVRRALLGSVAEQLIERLPCDVLAVPSPP